MYKLPATLGLIVLCAALLVPVHAAAADSKSYKLDDGGAEKLVKDLIESAKRGDLSPFAELEIPNYRGWFERVFGQAGATMAKVYEANRANMAKSLAEAMLSAGPKPKIQADNFRAGVPSAALVAVMPKPVPVFQLPQT